MPLREGKPDGDEVDECDCVPLLEREGEALGAAETEGVAERASEGLGTLVCEPVPLAAGECEAGALPHALLVKEGDAEGECD